MNEFMLYITRSWSLFLVTNGSLSLQYFLYSSEEDISKLSMPTAVCFIVDRQTRCKLHIFKYLVYLLIFFILNFKKIYTKYGTHVF